MKRRALLICVALLVSACGALWLPLRASGPAVPPPGLTLAHVTLVQPEEGRRTDQTLVASAERIERIAASAAEEVRDAYAGAYVLPGLVDLHVHHPPAFALGERELFALLFLAHGVTSVRDTGAVVGSVDGLRRRIQAGRVPGPRIFSCGQVLDGELSELPGARRLPDPAATRAAVDELARAGVDCIKAYNDLDDDTYAALREEAAAQGLPVVAHVPWQLPFDRMGAVEVQHLMGLSENWWNVTDTELDGYVTSSLAQHVTHTPTLVLFARSARLADYATLLDDPVARLLPHHHREVLWNPELNPFAREMAPVGGNDVELRVPVMLRAVAKLHAAGVRVTAGTDVMNPFVVPGASLQEELGLLAEAGLGIEGAWRAATREAGEALGMPLLGTLQVGAPADLLVFREDPTRDLAALATLEAVVAAGRLYPRSELDAAVATRRERIERSLYGRLAGPVARFALDRIY